MSSERSLGRRGSDAARELISRGGSAVRALRGRHELERALREEREARRRAEESAALRRAVEESILAGVAAIDTDGVQIYANPAFCEMVGWSREELIGKKPPFVYWPPDEIDKIQADLQATLRGDAPPGGFELRFCRKDGGLFDALVLVSPLRGEGGELRGWLASTYDITERKRVERRLHDEEQRLRLALEAGRMGTWDWEIASGRVRWSPELELVHGLEPGTFEGTYEAFRREIAEPEDRERVVASIRDTLLECRDRYEVEYRIRAGNGEERWLNAQGRLIFGEDGRPVRMIGICSDVTARRRREETTAFLSEASEVLARSLDRATALRSLARVAVPLMADWCAIHLLGDDGEIRPVEVAHRDPERVEAAWKIATRCPPRSDADSGVARAIRTGESEMVPIFGTDLIARVAFDEDHRRLLEGLALHSGMVVPLTARGRTFGAITFLSAESKRVLGRDDLALAEQLAARAALAIDNARLYREAEAARAAAQRAERDVRLLAEASDVLARAPLPEDRLASLARFACTGLADYCISYSFDGRRIRRVGLSHGDPEKLPLVEALHDAGPPTLDDAYGAGAVIRTGEPSLVSEIDLEVIARTVQNEAHRTAVERLLPRSSMIVPLVARGRTVGAVAFATAGDSERRYGEADLRTAQALCSRAALLVDNARLYSEAREAVRARDEMAAAVTHDLRNPLSTIKTAVQLLARASNPVKHAEWETSILRAVEQMERLLGDLLDIARLESGSFPIERDEVDVEGLMAELRELFEPRAEARQMRLDVNVADALPSVSGDRRRLVQVLVNLLSNAFEHTSDAGRVSLEAERSSGAVTLAVTDDGAGIRPEHRERIFDRFWQAEKGRRGTGLGLAIARGIVEAHDSALEVDSEVGRGSRFYFTLPAARR